MTKAADAAVLFAVWFASIQVTMTWIELSKEKRDAREDATTKAASLIAIFDMQGFRGTVEFHSNPAKDLFKETIVRVNLLGPSENEKLTWSIWERPIDLTTDDRCSADKLGTELVNLSEVYGQIGTGKEMLIRDTYALLDVTNLFERTLMIRSIRYGLKSCALIRSTVPLSWTAEARFISPVGGTLVIRHLVGVATGVRANLLWTSGKKIRNSKLHWSLVKIRPEVQTHRQEERLFRQRSCSHLWEMMASDQTVTLHVSSTDKTRVNVGGRRSTQNPTANKDTYMVETNFTSLLATTSDLLTDLWVILQWSADEFVACAPLLIVEPRETIANLDGSLRSTGVSGYVHFYQASGYGDATVITVNLTHENAAGFGIDQFTLWPATSGVGAECLDLSLSYFNPLIVDTQSSPRPSEGTTDRYAVGDLSGRMGSLLGRSVFRDTFYNQYLSLFGPNSVIGRSLVIYEDNWHPIACVNLVNEQKEILAIAKFQRTLDGEVIFRQRLEGPLGADTSLLVHIRYKAEKNSTKDHMWQIHSHGQSIISSEHFGQRRRVKQIARPDGEESFGTTVRPIKPNGCGTGTGTTQVFNPYAISRRTYSCDCDKSTDVRCALGDLGNRLGPIGIQHPNNKIESNDEETGGQLFVDTGLFLNGDFSVVGLTLAIYDNEYGYRIIDCATIELFDTK